MADDLTAWLDKVVAERNKLERDGVAITHVAAIAAVEAMQAITPVNTGETVRNYAVGVGARPTGGLVAVPEATEATNILALGAEAARGANEAAAVTEATQALSASGGKLKTIYITNRVDEDKWGLIESGIAPGPPWNSRGPGGQSAVGEAAARVVGKGALK